uniref:Thyroglobulin type-1 domain-containing protein n=1 Tax=Oryzias latipes TaxID=8090 RepID=A0A3P9HW40_ORYLA
TLCPTCATGIVEPTYSLFPPPESSVPALALGDPRGVYTRSCAHSLRCQPSEDETRPLHALLEGRGVCSNLHSDASTFRQIDQYTSSFTSSEPESGSSLYIWISPILLTIFDPPVMGLHAHLFQSHHDIYIPNCDKRGFFQKKTGGLCWSSRGKWRGKCWCVDENGTPISADISSSQSC